MIVKGMVIAVMELMMMTVLLPKVFLGYLFFFPPQN